METGSRLRLSGKGEGGSRGGPAGDLYVVLHVRRHDLFERHNEDILCDVPVPFPVAALGGEVEVPTIYGYAKLKIPGGTEPGKVFRLRNKGVVDLHSGVHGDHLARIVVEVPGRLNARQKRAVADLAAELDEGCHPGITAARRRADEFFERKAALERGRK